MIKIRYSDLPGGLHLSADVRGKHTILFLLPGLTAAQRKAAIRRARSAARVGHGPALPVLGLARAVAADRIATTIKNGFAAMRMHPAIFIPPMIMVLSVAIAYVLLVAVSFRFTPSQATGQRPALGAGAAAHRSGAAAPGGRRADDAAPGRPGSRSPDPSSRRSPGSPSPASPSPSPSASRSPGSPSPSALATPPPPAPSPPPPAPPSPSPSPSPSPDSGGGGVCVKIGPFGGCVEL